ncbi:MAG: hypothetical protein LWY06_16155 [Firmicutes bacterium]|nr:hypothetical protein [Bacillota bacterium]
MHRKQILWAYFILVFVFLISTPAFSEEPNKIKRIPKIRETYIELKVLNKSESPASDPTKITYGFELEIHNKAEQQVNLSNISFYLFDGMGGRYGVSSRRFSQRYSIKPGETIKLDRIYFLVPKKAQLSHIAIYKSGGVVAKASL